MNCCRFPTFPSPALALALLQSNTINASKGGRLSRICHLHCLEGRYSLHLQVNSCIRHICTIVVMMGLATAYLPRVSDLRALAVSALMLSQVFANPICFGNEGVQTSSFFSCQPDASESACCAPGDICYSNGLCSPGPTENQDTATPFFWNGCTNATFEIPECFSACYNRKFGSIYMTFAANL